MPDDIRISKLLSSRGICSRREADRFLERGWIVVNGEKAQVGQKAAENSEIELTEEAQSELTASVTILLNKPVGYVSHLAEKGYKDARKLVIPDNFFSPEGLRHKSKTDPRNLEQLAVAGRLDIESQGLLVFTQSGSIAKTLIGDNSKIEREYLVRVTGKLSKEGLQKLRHGLELDGKPLKPAKVDWINQDQLKFILKEGKKRQIRRMCEMVGLKVTGLKRVRIGRVKLGKIPEGQWRYLDDSERF